MLSEELRTKSKQVKHLAIKFLLYMAFGGATLLVLSLLLISLAVAFDSIRYQIVLKDIDRLAVGDSKMKVRELFGRPVNEIDGGTVILVPYEYDTWVYGRRFRWDIYTYNGCPYISFIEFRLFGPFSDDTLIMFDSQGKLVNIRKRK